ncbi:MAG TPA: hypothetical protein VMC62_08420 [Longilinea sp.]|nr:hypothetical protein [Longilinea sp.]
MEQTHVDELIQQTRQYEFADGLRELQLGLYFAIAGATLWLAFNPAWQTYVFTLMLTHRVLGIVVNFIPVVLPLAIVGGMLPVMNYLRRRWLWRESGMVKSRWMMVPKGVNILSAVIIVVALGLGALAWHFGYGDDMLIWRVLWASTGWSMGYTYIGVGRHIGLKRYVWMGAIGGLASTLVLFLPFGFSGLTLVLWLGWGVTLCTSGGLALRRAFQSVQEKS